MKKLFSPQFKLFLETPLSSQVSLLLQIPPKDQDHFFRSNQPSFAALIMIYIPGFRDPGNDFWFPGRERATGFISDSLPGQIFHSRPVPGRIFLSRSITMPLEQLFTFELYVVGWVEPAVRQSKQISNWLLSLVWLRWVNAEFQVDPTNESTRNNNWESLIAAVDIFCECHDVMTSSVR